MEEITFIRTLLKMVMELHRMGYERIRIVPSMAPSGCHWRCSITTKTEISKKHGAEFGFDKRSIANYSSGEKGDYFGWTDTAHDTPDALAVKFIQRFPELSSKGKGSDPEYARWYSMMMTATEPDGIIYSFADWDYPLDRFNILNMRETIIPLPPPGEAEDRRVQ